MENRSEAERPYRGENRKRRHHPAGQPEQQGWIDPDGGRPPPGRDLAGLPTAPARLKLLAGGDGAPCLSGIQGLADQLVQQRTDLLAHNTGLSALQVHKLRMGVDHPLDRAVADVEVPETTRSSSPSVNAFSTGREGVYTAPWIGTRICSLWTATPHNRLSEPWEASTSLSRNFDG
jgi:hypothetical protein